ncbi:probable LRR receptor-like serine threonine-kinase At3g47570 [Olea europaea subsp. europaea]|uniref:Probable LRR receptor-like serine threonine-kinase At3g47570 n=1 Tax=Olea europaea subsp. europaea TaxID=158383 RepID=A0A8S0S0X5_OLEEU|nr:probable LRR receptor-like serine threonine-kinase At3g47570 [Olea europaea subsp. europaea]
MNLCKVISSCSNLDFNVAAALENLHNGYSIAVIDSDLKPSNVLLDEDMVSHLSDFGIAKFLGTGESNAHTITPVTVGYIAPAVATATVLLKAEVPVAADSDGFLAWPLAKRIKQWQGGKMSKLPEISLVPPKPLSLATVLHELVVAMVNAGGDDSLGCLVLFPLILWW